MVLSSSLRTCTPQCPTTAMTTPCFLLKEDLPKNLSTSSELWKMENEDVDIIDKCII